MQPQANNPEVKAEEKIVQQQTAEPVVETKKEEEAPKIKSEENKSNWAAFRAQREAERKAKEESDRRAAEKAAEAEALRKALEAVTNKPTQHQQYEFGYNQTEETEEQRIEKKVQEVLKKERERLDQEAQQREIQQTPQRLQQQFPDFNAVMTTENIDYFEFHHPELAGPYRYMPDGFEKWSLLYKAIKKVIPNPDSLADQKKMERNLNKPGSISATGNSVGGNAMPSARLTEERKRQNWERMQKTLSGLS